MASELLPPPPFDFEKEPLVDGSVELNSDRLKDTVAWLVDCIRQQQKVLQTHEQMLASLNAGGNSAPTKDEGEMSPPAPQAKKSVTQDLEGTMKDELLSMQVTKLEHELNALPKTADLDRQRESILAELAVMSSNTDQRMKDGEDKLHTELGSATDELRERLQRIGDDLLQRLADLEVRTAQAEASADQAKASADQAKASADQAKENFISVEDRLENLVSIEDRLSIRMESMSVRIESVQAAAESNANWVASKLEDSTLAGTSRTVATPPKSPTDTQVVTQTSGEDAKQEFVPRVEASEQPSEPQTMQVPKPETPPKVELSLGHSAAGQESSTERSHNDSTSATYSDNANLVNAAAKDAAEQRASILQLFAMVQDLGGTFADSKKATQVLDARFEDIARRIEGVKEKRQEDQGKVQQIETRVEDLKRQIEQMGDSLSVPASSASEVEAMRKQWLNRAAVRAPAGAGKPRRQSSEESRSPSRSPSPRRCASPRPRAGSDKEPESSVVENRIIPDLPSGGDESASAYASPVPGLEHDYETQIDEVHAKLEKLDKRIDALQHETAPRIGKLADTVQELQQALLTEDGPSLASAVSSHKKNIGDLQKWSKDVDRKFRRIAPLDSEFSDVQLELERLRKLFEFVEKVLPSDASKAMSFFNKNESEKDIAAKRKSSKPKTSGGVLVDAVAHTLGPDVAFEQHKEKLCEEVRNHELRIADDLANLTNAVKSVQRDMQHTAGRTGDLIDRVARVEKRRAEAPTESEPPLTTQSGQVFSTELPTSAEGPSAQTASSERILETPASVGEYVSKNAMKKALEETKDDVRNWLDVLHSTIVSALQQKADSTKLNAILAQLQNAAGATGLSTENFAVLAKRALLGRCASCEANIDVDTAKLKRPPPVSKPPPWPAPAMTQGPLQIRPPIGAAALASATSANKLPKIPDARTTKEFPRSKIFKNNSQPDLRQVRTLEQGD